MGFVSIEKEDLQKKKPYAMGKKELKRALNANAEEQMAIREYIKNLKTSGFPDSNHIDTANKIWLALKTIHTQLEGLHRRAR